MNGLITPPTYLLIPHDAVVVTATLGALATTYGIHVNRF